MNSPTEDEETKNLARLPGVPLIIIAKFLAPEDLANLIDTDSSFQFLKKCLPTKLRLNAPDFDDDFAFDDIDDGETQEEEIIVSPKMFSGDVKKISMEFLWGARGYGLKIWIEIKRGSEIVGSNKPKNYNMMPTTTDADNMDQKLHKEIIINDRDFLANIRRGDILIFKRQVGIVERLGRGRLFLEAYNAVVNIEF